MRGLLTFLALQIGWFACVLGGARGNVWIGPLVVAVLGLILVVRLLVTATGYVPGVDDGSPWLAYLILGGIFLLAGMFLWRKKER